MHDFARLQLTGLRDRIAPPGDVHPSCSSHRDQQIHQPLTYSSGDLVWVHRVASLLLILHSTRPLKISSSRTLATIELQCDFVEGIASLAAPAGRRLSTARRSLVTSAEGFYMMNLICGRFACALASVC